MKTKPTGDFIITPIRLDGTTDNVTMMGDGRHIDRILACVSACAGIDDPADLRKQRDELLAACRKANTCASIPDYVRDVIRAAIADAEPQTGTSE